MAKTKQVGVRFNSEWLESLKSNGLAKSPQHALNLYESNYWGSSGSVKVQDLTKPTNMVKPKENPTTNFTIDSVPKKWGNQEDLIKEIKVLKSEKMPAEKTTPLSQKAWLFDQNKKISELQKLLQ